MQREASPEVRLRGVYVLDPNASLDEFQLYLTKRACATQPRTQGIEPIEERDGNLVVHRPETRQDATRSRGANHLRQADDVPSRENVVVRRPTARERHQLQMPEVELCEIEQAQQSLAGRSVQE